MMHLDMIGVMLLIMIRVVMINTLQHGTLQYDSDVGDSSDATHLELY